jgi:hypothetical protein
METSAKARINVDESFHELVRAIRKYNKVRIRSPIPWVASHNTKSPLLELLCRNHIPPKPLLQEAQPVLSETGSATLQPGTNEAVPMTRIRMAANV